MQVTPPCGQRGDLAEGSVDRVLLGRGAQRQLSSREILVVDLGEVLVIATSFTINIPEGSIQICSRAPPGDVVDRGFVVDLVHPGTPDQPHNPNPPR